MIILVIFAGCEKEEKIIQDDAIVTTDYKGMTIIEEVGMKNVFSSTNIQMPDRHAFSITEIYDKSFIMNERVYVSTIHYDESIKPGYKFVSLYSCDFNGENEEIVPINPVNEYADIKYVWYDSDYNLIVIEEFDYVYILTKFTASGEISFSIELNDIINNGITLIAGVSSPSYAISSTI